MGMGSKINETKVRTTETEELYNEALESSEMAKEDYQENKALLESVKELGVDDDVVEITESVRDGVQQEVEDFMHGEVGDMMDEGTELSNETEEFANENAELGHEAEDRFADLQENRFGTKGELGQETARESAESFEEAAQDIDELRSEKMERYESDLSEIAD